MSLVVHTESRAVLLYPSATATRARRFLPQRNASGVQTSSSSRKPSVNRYKVALPIRPNGSTAWVRATDVRATRVRHRLNVDLTRRRLSLMRDGKLVERFPIGVGRA